MPKLLDTLDIKGDEGSADAMSCQKEIVKKIREKEADYILAVKENQKTLYQDIKDWAWRAGKYGRCRRMSG